MDMTFSNGAPASDRRLGVAICRLVAIAILGVICVFHQEGDHAVEQAWRALRASSVFQYESFEPFLSAASFLFFIGAWGVLDFFVPAASEHRSTPSHDLSAWYGGTRMRDQLLWYIVPLVTLDLMFPRRTLPEAAPSLMRLVLEVVGAIAVYDVVFFAWHATMHRLPTLYRTVHAKHHRCYIQRAPESVQHTFIDGTMDVACSVFALNVLGCHPLSRAVYNIVIIGLITELHAGYDFPWQLHNLVPFRLLGGPPRHERHHREGTVYMQKFGTYLDEAFGFVPKKNKTPRVDDVSLNEMKHFPSRPSGSETAPKEVKGETKRVVRAVHNSSSSSNMRKLWGRGNRPGDTAGGGVGCVNKAVALSS